MDPNTLSGLLSILSAAVTPVVMISACAGLLISANNRHGSLSDRVRTLVAEYRHADTLEARRHQIRAEIPLFYRRFQFTWLALTALFSSICCFILTTLLLVVTERKWIVAGRGTLTLFNLGIVLMLVSVLFQALEITLTTKSLHVEMEDILAEPSSTKQKPS